MAIGLHHFMCFEWRICVCVFGLKIFTFLTAIVSTSHSHLHSCAHSLLSQRTTWNHCAALESATAAASLCFLWPHAQLMAIISTFKHHSHTQAPITVFVINCQEPSRNQLKIAAFFNCILFWFFNFIVAHKSTPRQCISMANKIAAFIIIHLVCFAVLKP